MGSSDSIFSMIDRKDILTFDGAVIAGLLILLSIQPNLFPVDTKYKVELLYQFLIFSAALFAISAFSVSAGITLFSQARQKDAFLGTSKVFAAIGLFSIVVLVFALTKLRYDLIVGH